LDEAQRKVVAAKLYDTGRRRRKRLIASMAIQRLLDDLDLKADAMLGYSAGEFAAIVASGVGRFGDRSEQSGRCAI